MSTGRVQEVLFTGLMGRTPWPSFPVSISIRSGPLEIGIPMKRSRAMTMEMEGAGIRIVSSMMRVGNQNDT
jgi:hypothetical protein